MAKAKPKTFMVLMVPEKGEPQEDENGRAYVRVHQVVAENEGGAREVAQEQAMAEASEHGRPLYVVKSCELV